MDELQAADEPTRLVSSMQRHVQQLIDLQEARLCNHTATHQYPGHHALRQMVKIHLIYLMKGSLACNHFKINFQTLFENTQLTQNVRIHEGC